MSNVRRYHILKRCATKKPRLCDGCRFGSVNTYQSRSVGKTKDDSGYAVRDKIGNHGDGLPAFSPSGEEYNVSRYEVLSFALIEQHSVIERDYLGMTTDNI